MIFRMNGDPMSDPSICGELTRFDNDPLRAVERKLVIGSLALGIGLLTLLGLIAHL